MLVVATAVAVIAVTGYLLSTWPPDPPPAPDAERLRGAEPSPSSSREEDLRALVVLGDSYSAESTAGDGPGWPELLDRSTDWEVVTEAVYGSGYVSQGDGARFGERVPAVIERDANVILVAGGVDDLGVHPMRRIVDNANDVVTRLAEGAPEAQVVVVSPFSNDDPGPLTQEFSAELRTIAQSHGLPYVDATDWLVPGEEFFGDDPARPDDRGQQRIAAQMEKALSDLDLAQ